MTSTNDFCMPLVLRRCLVDRLAGTVAIRVSGDPAPVATLHVRDGAVVFVTSTDRDPRPAERSQDYIGERVCALAELVDAAAAFEPDDADFPHQVPVPIPGLIFDCVRSLASLERVAAWAGPTETVLELDPAMLEALPGVSIGPAEGFFISRMDSPMSIAEMLDEAPIERGLALRLICALRFVGCVRTAGPHPWFGDRSPFGETAASATPATMADSGVDMAEIARVCYLVDEKLRSVNEGADHYVLLEVERRATPERIKAAYREIAKTFHPDRNAQLVAYDAGIKDRLDTIFASLTSAYATLSNPKERDAYDQKLAKRDLRTTVPTPSRTVPPPPPRPPQRPPHEPPSPKRAPEARATPPAARPPVPSSIVPPVPRAPNPPPRAEMPTPPPPPRAPAPPVLQPDQIFEHGVVLADSGDLERAVQAFRRASELAPNDARIQTALGAALADLRGLDKAAEAALRRAAELNPSSPELFVELSLIYKRFDRLTEAKTLLKRAYLLDPTNEAVLRTLAENGMGPPDSVRGFFKRIFNRK